jgi:hypothetical protein
MTKAVGLYSVPWLIYIKRFNFSNICDCLVQILDLLSNKIVYKTASTNTLKKKYNDYI